MNKPELKPCPFCGGKSRWCGENNPKTEDDHICHEITCDTCSYQFVLYSKEVQDAETIEEAKDFAKKIWNNRCP